MHVLIAGYAPAAAHMHELERRGHQVSINNRNLLKGIEETGAELVLLHVEMGETSVLTHLRERGYDTPVIVLSEGDGPEQVADYLDAGADDYVTEVVRVEELVARMRAVVRRCAKRPVTEVQFGRLCVNFYSGEILVNEQPVPLTLYEKRLVLRLARTPRKPVSFRELEKAVWGDGNVPSQPKQTLQAFASRARQKLFEAGAGPETIHAVYGEGYILH